MSADLQRVADTRAWLIRAATDLRAAEHERSADPPITADMVFHAQQAVEKTFKAFLAWHDRPFRKTHNLVELGQQGAVLAPDLENVFRRVAPLTEYAWRFRYPGEASDPSLEEAEEALALAKGLFETLRKRLPPETYP